MTSSSSRRSLVAAVVGIVIVTAGGLFVWPMTSDAQPDPRQMSGLPLPDGSLPDGTITVRVVRGAVTNNVPGQAVELRQGDTVETAVTDAEGRATFFTLNSGQEVRASTELDGERLESQLFAVPGRGGVRVMLVGVDPENPPLPAESGTVAFGEESWVQVELVEESVEVYYLFQILNSGLAPVDPEVPVAFDLPSEAEGTTVLQGSSPRTQVDGRRVELPGPFESGVTPLQVAYILPYSDESLVLSQELPIDMEALLVSVEQWGNVDFVSSQVTRRMAVPASETRGVPYQVGSGPRIAAGQPVTIELVGLPFRSSTPSNVALLLAVGILALGVWGGLGEPEATTSTNRRRTLETRKEKLFTDLVKIERQRRTGKIGSTKYRSRQRELFVSLERVYRELDEQLTSVLLSSASAPDPQIARRSGSVG